MPTGNLQPAGLAIMKPEDSPETAVQPDAGFYRRWSEKKQASRQSLAEQDETVEEQQQPGDEDMPTLESLDENSDYSGFLSPRVSDQLRQVALRKLFHSAAFNVCDGLDDYAEDFTSFEKLGDLMTADLRHRLEQEADRQQAEADESASRPGTMHWRVTYQTMRRVMSRRQLRPGKTKIQPTRRKHE
ncbi:MAG: DUF3306 domain-containing protein [Candidatus Thiodiazotropha sp. (ex Lucina pensylvanica)]|nr:DUF3306 domain-containing protein [Candidatus Thiodiazotropha sp. (ex Lucina pensylvanica)]